MKGLVYVLSTVGLVAAGCGGGTPVRVVIDEFDTKINVSKMVAEAVAKVPVVQDRQQPLPELWPQSLPNVSMQAVLATPPVSVDLTPPPDSPNADKYEKINQLGDVVERIEVNRLVLRVDRSTLSIGLPESRLQLAASADAKPDDRLAWRTVAIIPAAPPGFVGDIELVYVPGGESFLNDQLADSDKEFSIRVHSRVDVNLERGKPLPRGQAVARLIVMTSIS